MIIRSIDLQNFRNYKFLHMDFDEKTKTYYHELQNCQTENDYINLLTEIGHYLVTRINQPIQDETILQASLTGMQVLNNLDENTLKTLKKEQEISHKKREESNSCSKIT